jgi:hypothetical protein
MTSAETLDSGNLSYLETRLVSRFDQLHPDQVRRCLLESVAEFGDARVRTYLVVLIERAATDRLRVLERDLGPLDGLCGDDGRLPFESAQTRERDNGRTARTGHRVVPAIG